MASTSDIVDLQTRTGCKYHQAKIALSLSDTVEGAVSIIEYDRNLAERRRRKYYPLNVEIVRNTLESTVVLKDSGIIDDTKPLDDIVLRTPKRDWPGEQGSDYFALKRWELYGRLKKRVLNPEIEQRFNLNKQRAGWAVQTMIDVYFDMLQHFLGSDATKFVSTQLMSNIVNGHRKYWHTIVLYEPYMMKDGKWISEDMYIPVNKTNNHWTLVTVNTNKKLIKEYNSYKGLGSSLEAVRKFLQDTELMHSTRCQNWTATFIIGDVEESGTVQRIERTESNKIRGFTVNNKELRKKNLVDLSPPSELQLPAWTIVQERTPQQGNDQDCGFCAMEFAKLLAMGEDIMQIYPYDEKDEQDMVQKFEVIRKRWAFEVENRMILRM